MKHPKPVHTLLNVETGDSANEHSLFIGQLFVGDIQNTDWRAELRVCDFPVTFKLDSGAQANVLPVSTYRCIKPMQQLEPTKTVSTVFGNVRIKPVGVIKLQVTCPDTKRNQVMEFFVTDTDDIPILGMFEKEYDIEVDPSVRPVIQAPRKLPYAKYDQLKETIAKLEEEEIIASVDKPTDWVHNLVITEKRNGSLRICFDPRPLNKAIKR